MAPAAEDQPLDESDVALIERAQRGDAAAFEALVRRHQEIAFRVAYFITGSPTDAEDAAQEGFLRAYRALSRFRLGEPIRPWLLRIIANAARSRRGVAARQATVTLGIDADRQADDPDRTPEELALAAERQQQVLSAVGRLRTADQQVINCRYFLELS